MIAETVRKHRCKNCGNDYPRTTDFWPKSGRKKGDGLAYRCKACKKADIEAWRRTFGGRLKLLAWSRSSKNLEYHRTYQKTKKTHAMRAARRLAEWAKAPLAVKARNYVTDRVRRGVLVRPMACQNCSRTERPPRAFFWNYLDPHNVSWFCWPCHKAISKKLGPCPRQRVALPITVTVHLEDLLPKQPKPAPAPRAVVASSANEVYQQRKFLMDYYEALPPSVRADRVEQRLREGGWIS